MRPPKRGPRVGPSRGPRRYQPNMPARWLGWNMSLIVPPPLAMPTPVLESVLSYLDIERLSLPEKFIDFANNLAADSKA